MWGMFFLSGCSVDIVRLRSGARPGSTCGYASVMGGLGDRDGRKSRKLDRMCRRSCDWVSCAVVERKAVGVCALEWPKGGRTSGKESGARSRVYHHLIIRVPHSLKLPFVLIAVSMRMAAPEDCAALLSSTAEAEPCWANALAIWLAQRPTLASIHPRGSLGRQICLHRLSWLHLEECWPSATSKSIDVEHLETLEGTGVQIPAQSRPAMETMKTSVAFSCRIVHRSLSWSCADPLPVPFAGSMNSTGVSLASHQSITSRAQAAQPYDVVWADASSSHSSKKPCQHATSASRPMDPCHKFAASSLSDLCSDGAKVDHASQRHMAICRTTRKTGKGRATWKDYMSVIQNELHQIRQQLQQTQKCSPVEWLWQLASLSHQEKNDILKFVTRTHEPGQSQIGELDASVRPPSAHRAQSFAQLLSRTPQSACRAIIGEKGNIFDPESFYTAREDDDYSVCLSEQEMEEVDEAICRARRSPKTSAVSKVRDRRSIASGTPNLFFASHRKSSDSVATLSTDDEVERLAELQLCRDDSFTGAQWYGSYSAPERELLEGSDWTPKACRKARRTEASISTPRVQANQHGDPEQKACPGVLSPGLSMLLSPDASVSTNRGHGSFSKSSCEEDLRRSISARTQCSGHLGDDMSQGMFSDTHVREALQQVQHLLFETSQRQISGIPEPLCRSPHHKIARQIRSWARTTSPVHFRHSLSSSPEYQASAKAGYSSWSVPMLEEHFDRLSEKAVNQLLLRHQQQITADCKKGVYSPITEYNWLSHLPGDRPPAPEDTGTTSINENIESQKLHSVITQKKDAMELIREWWSLYPPHIMCAPKECDARQGQSVSTDIITDDRHGDGSHRTTLREFNTAIGDLHGQARLYDVRLPEDLSSARLKTLHGTVYPVQQDHETLASAFDRALMFSDSSKVKDCPLDGSSVSKPLRTGMVEVQRAEPPSLPNWPDSPLAHAIASGTVRFHRERLCGRITDNH